jgi:aryl carrier-like protein
VARILGLAAAALDPGKPLIAHGLDSLAAVEVQPVLESRLRGG